MQKFLDSSAGETVAPCAGAWVEILGWWAGVPRAAVAPCAGAWVEIPPVLPRRLFYRSLPVRERGLKCRLSGRSTPIHRSLPVRERGLKYNHIQAVNSAFMSLPVRERGLKSVPFPPSPERRRVAPCAGAWVETEKEAG